MRRGLSLVVLAVLAPLCLLLFAGVADAAPAAGHGITFSATLDGRDAGSATTNNPLVLQPGHNLTVGLTVDNPTAAPVTVATARIGGEVMGLSFFSFDTQLNLQVPPGATKKITVSIGLGGLSSQADGLLPSEIALLGTDDSTLASHGFSVDVKGKLTSIYGVFGLAVLGVTLLWLVSLIYRVATRTLPQNRWSRAVQFCAAGFGVGLVLTFSVSALRLLTPDASVWGPFVFGAGLIGLVIGYFTPGPRVDSTDEDFLADHDLVPAQAQSRQWDGYGEIGGSGPFGDGAGLAGVAVAVPRAELREEPPYVGTPALEDGAPADTTARRPQPSPDGVPDNRTTVVGGGAPWFGGAGAAAAQADADTDAAPGEGEQLRRFEARVFPGNETTGPSTR